MKTRHRLARTAVFCTACGFAALIAASAALAAEDQRPVHDSIDAALSATAEEVAVQLKSVYGVQEVAIDGFQSIHSTAGPRLNLALRTALEKQLAVRDAAAIRIAGTFDIEKAPAAKRGLAMSIAPVLVQGGKTVETLQKRLVVDAEVIGAASSLSVWLPSEDARTGGTTETGELKWQAELRKLLSPPVSSLAPPGASEPRPANSDPSGEARPVVQASSIIRPAEGSPFGMQVLREQQGRFVPCAITGVDPDGVSKVGVALDDNLAFAVYNQSEQPVGVEIFIDGINILHFSKEWSQLGKWYLAAQEKPALFTGWHLEGSRVNSFQVRYANAMDELFRKGNKARTITVVYYKTFEQKRTIEGSQEDSITIGQGDPREMDIRQVAARFGTVPDAIINLRYEGK